ncbi:MAG: class B sortase [Solobacterium sp.]|nr:class B sortase [Solobacterium sp.]
MAERKKKNRRSVSIFLDLCVVLLLGTACFSGWKLYRGLHEYSASASAYEQIRHDTVTKKSESSETEEVYIDFEALKEICPDIGGWISLKDSAIDYPFVYAPDNSFYLTHLFSGEYNKSGAVFVDAGNSRDFADRVTVLYAHHMKNGTMFADVENYKDPAYYTSHREFDIYTEEGNYKLYPLAGYVTNGSQNYVRFEFADDADFCAYVQGFIDRSDFVSAETFTADDKIVMLSTCSYDVADGRYVLIGKLHEIRSDYGRK